MDANWGGFKFPFTDERILQMREYMEWLLREGEHIVSALEDAMKRWLGGY